MNDLISIIIPVYNAEEKLIACIESIEKNTYKNIEVLLIDDGSYKKTKELCDTYKEKYSNIKVYHNKNNGVSFSRNFGIQKSTGTYIMFVDADDIVDKNIIEILYKDCKENNADFSMCSYNECTIQNIKNEELIESYAKEVFENDEILKEFLEDSRIGWNVWAKLYKKEIIKNVEFPINMYTGEDMYFLYKVCKKAKKIVLNELKLYNYIRAYNTAMENKNYWNLLDTYYLINDVIEDVKNETHLSEYYYKFYQKNMIWFFKLFLSKPLNKEQKNKIKECRKIFFENIEKNRYKNSRQSFEYNLFKYFYYVFIVYSKIYYKVIRKNKANGNKKLQRIKKNIKE